MRVIWIGQQYGGGLRECTFIDDDAREQSTFFATDQQAREFATEMEATIREAASYDAEPNTQTDPWLEMTDDLTGGERAMNIPRIEDDDPAIAKITARLREILKDLPRSQYRSVGWGWWDELQGRDPDESDFYESDIRSLSDLFDDCIQEMEEKSRGVGQVIERGGCLR